MSTPGNTAKLGTAHSNIQTPQSCLSLVKIKPTMPLVSILLSQRINPPCQPGMKAVECFCLPAVLYSLGSSCRSLLSLWQDGITPSNDAISAVPPILKGIVGTRDSLVSKILLIVYDIPTRFYWHFVCI